MPPSFLPPKGAISVGMTLSLPASTRYQSSFRSDRTSASRVVIASEAKQSRAAQRSSVRDCFVAEPVLGSARDCFASLAMMRWTASAPRHRSASRRSCRNVHIEEAVHGRGWHDRIGYREAGVSGARCRRRRRDRLSPPIAAGRDRDVLRQAAALSGRAGGVRHGALPGPPDCRPRPSGAVDAADPGEALCQMGPQERPNRRAGLLRGGEPAEHAVRAAEERARAGGADDPSSTPAVGRAAHPIGQLDPRPDGREGDHRTPWTRRVRRPAGDDRAPGRPASAGRGPPHSRGSGPAVAQPRPADRRARTADYRLAQEQPRRLAARHPPAIRPDLSSALVATAGEPKRFDSGRQFAAWVGLVPAQNSTGGKQRRGGVTKAGARHLRQLLVVAATGLIPRVRANPEISPWFARLLARMPPRKATVALANKMARRLGAARQTNDLPRAGCDRNRSSGLIAAGATPTASQPNARAMDHDEHRSVEPRFGPPRHVIELRARRNDYASPSADVIRASGHSAAHTGRTHDRTRPDGFFFPCTAWAVHT